MKFKNRSIIIWVFLTLTAIGILPFLLSWYQINNSQEAIINQSQKSHMIVARATADRMENLLDQYVAILNALGNNPAIYLQPDSEDASELLKSTVVAQNEIYAIGLVMRPANGENNIIQLVKKNQIDSQEAQLLIKKRSDKAILLTTLGDQKQMLMHVKTARPQVYLSAILPLNIDDVLNPSLLGDFASLSLVKNDGSLIKHSGEGEFSLPQSLSEQFKSGNMLDSANRYGSQGQKSIFAIASIKNAEWSIISKQPIKAAESAASEMVDVARKVFFFVLLAMILLILWAYFSWVMPLRKIISAYQNLLGEQTQKGEWKGNELTALERSFETISKHIDNRNALSQIFVDRYQVISQIGMGGMGSVFLGWDPRLKRHVALKTLPIKSSFASRRNMSETLVQEAITAARISHRNVVSIFDVVSTNATAFIAMEYIDGETLHAFILRNKRLSIEHTVVIAIAISKGLHSAHELGFVHRDIKPENILLGINGDIKITDFGTTALLQTLTKDHVTGTSGYIAPEIYEHGSISVKSDLFALGALIATCLLGKNPFLAKKVHITRSNTLNKKVLFPEKMVTEKSHKLIEVILRLLDKNPDNRPETAAEVARMISDAAPQKPHWNAKLAGIQSSKELIYASSENTTVISHDRNRKN